MPGEAITRLRWRRRGAWQWPTFAAALVAEALLLHLLPIAGSGIGLPAATILAGCLNLVILAALAPLAGLVVRRRRPDLPRPVARDYAATALMVVLAGAIVALGLAHRPAVLAGQRSFQAQSNAARRYVRLNAGPEYRRRIDGADTWQLERHLYRTCVPGADPARRLCLFIDTAQSPPGVTVDPNRAPNSTYVGPDAVGRGRG
ncbi:MAG: hypothetical protein ACR2KV_09345 [Solirubrobacteraceae bacterium]